MPNYDAYAKQFFSCKTASKKPNFCNLALKMPAWQPCNWIRCGHTGRLQCCKMDVT